MSVLMTLRLDGDRKKLEEWADANKEKLTAIKDRAVEKGVIGHRFFGDDDGHIMVVDEWPDRESFESFFGEAQDEIGPMMQEVGITNQPQPEFWEVLETHDKHGWDESGV